MKQRCLNPNHKVYNSYGGRGISLCDHWQESFLNFYNDMGDCPKGCSLDRIDNNLGYFKENCRWTSRNIQGFNRRKHSNNKSGKTGVFWSNLDKKWKCQIKVNGKNIHLGYFEDKDLAIEIRNNAELKYYGFNKD